MDSLVSCNHYKWCYYVLKYISRFMIIPIFCEISLQAYFMPLKMSLQRSNKNLHSIYYIAHQQQQQQQSQPHITSLQYVCIRVCNNGKTISVHEAVKLLHYTPFRNMILLFQNKIT